MPKIVVINAKAKEIKITEVRREVSVWSFLGIVYKSRRVSLNFIYSRRLFDFQRFSDIFRIFLSLYWYLAAVDFVPKFL